MDDRVKVEYDKILTAAIIKHGSLMDTTPTAYGWHTDEDFGPRGEPRHSVSCGIASSDRVEEDASWFEFCGTDADDNYKHGMEVYGVTCNCGKISNRTFRWSSSLGEAIRAVVTDLVEQKLPRRGKTKDECCGSDLCVYDDRGFGQRHSDWTGTE